MGAFVSHDECRREIAALREEIRELRAENAALRAENAALRAENAALRQVVAAKRIGRWWRRILWRRWRAVMWAWKEYLDERRVAGLTRGCGLENLCLLGH